MVLSYKTRFGYFTVSGEVDPTQLCPVVRATLSPNPTEQALHEDGSIIVSRIAIIILIYHPHKP
jgi:hypothetical protein